jgi:anti-sigma B factor antagonist
MTQADAAGRLRLEYRLHAGVAVVEVSGEIDVSTSALLRERLLRVVTDGRHRDLVVNLAGVSFIDSAGIGVLVGVWHRVLATDGVLALAAPSRQARGILDMTGLARVLPVYDTEAGAVQAYQRVKAP